MLRSKLDPFLLPEDKIKDRVLKRKKVEWQPSLQDFSRQKDEPVGSEFLGLFLEPRKLRYFSLGVTLVFLFLLARTAELQVVQGDYYYQMAEENRIRMERLPAVRGVIYDRQGELLVENIPSFVLVIVPADLPNEEAAKNKVIDHLAKIINETPSAILNRIKDEPAYSYRPIIIKEKIAYDQAIILEIASVDLPGINLVIESRRKYLPARETNYLSSLSHILGYEGRITTEELVQHPDYGFNDYLGKTGLEFFYEDILRGQDGKEQVEVNALGKKEKMIARLDPEAGANLVLTIDLALQQKVEEVLTETLTKLNLRKSTAVVLDPHNGEILALVSLPSFDNNLFAQGISHEDYQVLMNDVDHPLFFRAISGTYSSGSTIKPIIAAAALEEGIITRYTSILSVGGIRIGQWFFPDWRAGGHGPTNVTKAIADSVNTFFYYLGGGYENFTGLGLGRIYQYASLFGLGEILGIDLPFEEAGFLPTETWKEEAKGERWYLGDTYHLAIGQGDILVTPLQVSNWTAVFANGGTLYRPHLVREILNASGETIQKIEAEVIRDSFIAARNIEIVKDGLRQAVTSGSARGMLSLPITSSGKTGTAQWSTESETHAWFTAYAPHDEPEIVMTVLVEEGGEGSTVALPVVREVLDWWFQRKNH